MGLHVLIRRRGAQVMSGSRVGGESWGRRWVPSSGGGTIVGPRTDEDSDGTSVRPRVLGTDLLVKVLRPLTIAGPSTSRK